MSSKQVSAYGHKTGATSETLNRYAGAPGSQQMVFEMFGLELPYMELSD